MSAERNVVKPNPISVRCRLLARYAELIGLEEVTVTLDAGSSVADAVAKLRQDVPNGGQLPSQPLVALNHEHVLSAHVLQDGDELALLPPLAGG